MATVFVAFLGMGLYRVNRPTKIPSLPSKSMIEESMMGVKAYRFDNTGELSQEMQMKQGFRYRSQNTFHMVAPMVKIYHRDACWHIRADQGESRQAGRSKKIDQLFLYNHVEVKRIETQKNPIHHNWVLKTHSLQYSPTTALATSNDPVTLLNGEAQIQAQGLRADFNEHTIELLKRVNSHYAKQRS